MSDLLDVSLAWQGQVVSSALAAPFAELNDEIAELQRKRLGQLYAAVHRVAPNKEMDSRSNDSNESNITRCHRKIQEI